MTQPGYSIPQSLIYKADILNAIPEGDCKILPVKSAIQPKCVLT